ncbi:NYN domain-containing protein [Halobaculum gomorrense]|uniref:TIGR00288 family protein n=1 Tax=Halobaculum gomorrense TaxID=43928 RepID=A0A1M5TQK2_9EURY|nr:NYN domain-containing protein [Halobaculum gomorrense]SHH53105.1 TIGR00288 family protein [Halobaculum gomorrense]
MGLLDRILGVDAAADAPGTARESPVDAGAAGPHGPWRDADGSLATPRGVALFVDGPNVFREEFDVDLADLRGAATRGDGTGGDLVTARLYLDEHATPGLIQAAEANGFQVITTSGDVDVKLAVDAASFAAERRAATVAIASRDTDFKPALEVANEYGLRTLAIAPGSYGRSDALRRSADDAVTLGE